MNKSNQVQSQKPDKKKPTAANIQLNGNSNKSLKNPPKIDTAKPTLSKADKDAHAKMLEAFWKLSEYNNKIRLEGLRQINAYFGKLDPVKDKQNYDYVITRLIKGLASNRKCSRLGFSCALTELITNYNSLTFGYIIKSAKTLLNYESVESTDFTKEEIRHMQIGLVFVYLCFIQSERDLDQTSVKHIIDDLNELRHSNKDAKAYIKSLYLQAFIVLIKSNKITDASIQNMFGLVENDLKSIWETLSSNQTLNNADSLVIFRDNLNLLLAILNKYPNETRDFLKQKNLKLKTIFSTKNMDIFHDLLSQSTESLPSLQPICSELFTYLINHEPDFYKHLWNNLIETKLCKRREQEKKILCFKLYLFSLNLVNEANYKSIFFDCLANSSNILQSLSYNYTHRNSNINMICRTVIVKELIEIIKQKEVSLPSDVSIGSDLLIQLTEYSKNCHELSDLTHMAIMTLNSSGLNKFFDYLINTFSGKEKEQIENTNGADYDDDDESNNNSNLVSRQVWLVNQITNLAKNGKTFENDKLVEKILNYLTIHSYFVCENPEPNKTKFELGANLIKNDKLETNLRESLIEYIGVLLSKPESHVKLINLLKTIEKLLDTKSKTGIKPIEKYARKQDDLRSLCERMIKLLEKVYQHINIETKTADGQANRDVLHTFFMVICIECFRMFDSLKSSKQVMDDIEICFNKFMQQEMNEGPKKNTKNKSVNKKKQADDDEDIDWIDVLVEMLLNLFTINKSWIRNSVKLQFKKLFPKLTIKSVQLIVDLLGSENDLLVEDEEMDIDDDDVEEDEEEKESEDSDSNKKSGKSKNEEDESGVEDLSLSPPYSKDKDESDESDDEEEDNEKESNDEDDDDEDDIENANDSTVDQVLKDAVLKGLGDAYANEDNDENSDLDDEAMLKLDETIAAAFKMRKKDKSHQTNVLQYKLRVLDFIQEIFKSTYRLDLITFLIKPMLHILFESQTKPHLKCLSQRILGFLVNLKNTTKKINESKLPPLDELFELLSHVIDCSTKHFNVTNTLVETSMFCVRLILHLANTNEQQNEKELTLKKLTEIYSEIIKNDKLKINPIMYKEYLIRYSVYSIPLAIQMIDTASQPDVKLHKKTVTLVTLYQTINHQMFTEINTSQSNILIEKLFKFFDQLLDEIIKDENLHIKFVDAFLNLVTRVLNLPKQLFKKEYTEKLASKLAIFTKETKVKQAYKSRFLNLIQLCHKSFK